MHIGAKCLFIFRWGFGKPLLRIQGCIENEKCSPGKVSFIKYLQIDTLHTQKLEFIHLELACPAKVFFFWRMLKMRVLMSKKSPMLKNSSEFQLFVNFSIDSDSSAIKFFRTGSK